jgi:hypothetical protein
MILRIYTLLFSDSAGTLEVDMTEKRGEVEDIFIIWKILRGEYYQKSVNAEAATMQNSLQIVDGKCYKFTFFRNTARCSGRIF